ncbi:hypothetical protein D3874_03235 [Oleomonas cavernae]|uniref:Uncharacterized protein n=1 Tax=Oleomonas cavernae TaxID=2320859 RepID=A0A418WUA1_9PROT|nr:hypothetical protein [Oleomonas cavernae]RJF94842.1 hypothetical protein D3874_03235 [Oleomonas cavernae]
MEDNQKPWDMAGKARAEVLHRQREKVEGQRAQVRRSKQTAAERESEGEVITLLREIRYLIAFNIANTLPMAGVGIRTMGETMDILLAGAANHASEER